MGPPMNLSNIYSHFNFFFFFFFFFLIFVLLQLMCRNTGRKKKNCKSGSRCKTWIENKTRWIIGSIIIYILITCRSIVKHRSIDRSSLLWRDRWNAFRGWVTTTTKKRGAWLLPSISLSLSLSCKSLLYWNIPMFQVFFPITMIYAFE
jgi:uncharacterized membrane protein